MAGSTCRVPRTDAAALTDRSSCPSLDDPGYIVVLMYGGGLVMALCLGYFVWMKWREGQERINAVTKRMQAEDEAFERATLREIGLTEEDLEDPGQEPVFQAVIPESPRQAPTWPPAVPASVGVPEIWGEAPISPPTVSENRGQAPNSPPGVSAGLAVPGGEIGASPRFSPRVSPAIAATQPIATMEELVSRLVKLGVVTGLEGRLPMPIPPDGLIYRLRSGGLALLLARLESEAFLAHQSRRYDHIFALSSAGEVLVITRVQQALVDLLDAPAAADPGKFRASRDMDLT